MFHKNMLTTTQAWLRDVGSVRRYRSGGAADDDRQKRSRGAGDNADRGVMRQDRQRLLERYWVLLAAPALFLGFAATVPGLLAIGNLLAMIWQISLIGILAVAIAVALLAGEIDLSVASVCSLAAIAASLMLGAGYSPWLAIAAAVVTGLAAGAGNGLAATLLHVPSWLASLAVAAVARALAGLLALLGPGAAGWPDWFRLLGRGTLLWVPAPLWWFVPATALVWLYLGHFRGGARLTAVGEDGDTARRTGLPVRRLKLIGLMISGGLAGVTALPLISVYGPVPAGAADDLLFPALTGALVGVSNGRARIGGAVAGAVASGILGNALLVLHAPDAVRELCLGLAALAAAAWWARGVAARARPSVFVPGEEV